MNNFRTIDRQTGFLLPPSVDEWLPEKHLARFVVACSGRARHALARYRQRWTIETLFGNLKTKGFALEATHLTDPNKLCTLLALLAFAVALTVKTGVAMARLHPIPVKKHGRRAWSLFALGLHTLRKIFVAASPDQIIAFLGQLLSPKLPIKSLRFLAFR